MFKKYTPFWWMKTTQLSRSVKQLTNNVHLAASAWWIYVVWIDGIPQSIVYLPCSDKFIGYQLKNFLFYNHTWHQMIDATRRDKNGVLQKVPWSVGGSLSDMTSASRGSPNQPIRRSWPKTEKLQTVAEVYLKCSAKLLEASWRIVNSSRSCIKNRLKGTYSSDTFCPCCHPAVGSCGRRN